MSDTTATVPPGTKDELEFPSRRRKNLTQINIAVYAAGKSGPEGLTLFERVQRAAVKLDTGPSTLMRIVVEDWLNRNGL